MHWMETLFGLSPDNGDGSTEISIAICAVLLIAMTIGVLQFKNARSPFAK